MKRAIIARDSHAHWKYTLSIPGTKYRWHRKRPCTSLWSSQDTTLEILLLLAGLTQRGYDVSVVTK